MKLIHIKNILEVDYYINPEQITAFEIVRVKDSIDMDSPDGVYTDVYFYQVSVILNTGQLITDITLYGEKEEILKKYNIHEIEV